MSKCHVGELEQVFRAIFTDALYTFPTLGADFEKDLTRLLVLVARRGIRVYLEDLPAVGKHLDRCLSCGQYELSGLPLTKRFSGRVVIPKFLRGLYLLVFHEHGRLREDYSSDALFFLRQILFAAKKAKFQCSDDKIEDAVLDFIDTDAQLPEPEGYWNAVEPQDLLADHPYRGFGKSELLASRVDSLPTPQRRRQASLFLTNLDMVSSIVTTTLGSYDPQQWRFRHGPGAVAGCVGPSNKYSWTDWSTRLELEFPIADYGYHSYASWADICDASRWDSSSEPTSRLVAVPKSFGGPRLIAAEPQEHQWCQQNIWHYFCRRTSATWIGLSVRFTDQSRNQELCTTGSKDDALATVDLSAASDRVTCHVVGQYFRSNPNLLSCLRASRTRQVAQKLVPHAPAVVQLRKFSTMGSANTFPVESLIFLSIALAAVATKRGFRHLSPWVIQSLEREVAVFGDDIVIPSDSRELFVRALEVLYFKVNDQKSFWTGKFRESCGVDSFRGVNVTPAYWRVFNDGKPESLASTVETRNNFYKKFLVTAASRLASTIPWDIPTVHMGSGVFGLKSFTGADCRGFKTRENSDLQRTEVFVACQIGVQTKTAIEDDSALLQFFTEDPSPFTKWTSGVPQRPATKIRRRWVALADLGASCAGSN
jgi:hypothetical protein